ncbi:MAG: thiosulfate sulfurtransferase GlpE [Halioglobus sp.]
MGQFKHITSEAAKALLENSATQLVDIRDEQSFNNGHIQGAIHLDNSGVQDFIREGDPDQPLIVCCYHGNSSQSAAAFLNDKGFEEVYSLDGGFELWRGQYPTESN